MAISTATIIGANGDVIACDRSSNYDLAGTAGLFGTPPIRLGQRDSPGLIAGSLKGKPRRLAKPYLWQIVVYGDTHQECVEALERLATAVDPVTPGADHGRDCRLIVTRPDGSHRQLEARYSSGLDVWPFTTGQDTAVTVEVLFRADDPHWSALTPDTESVEFPVTGSGSADTPTDDADTITDDPATPTDGFLATPEEGTVTATLVNEGNAEAWPVWEITGSVLSAELTNVTTGAVWRWDGVLTAAQTLAVDTNDRAPSVRVDGANAWSGLAAGAKNLWPLAPGANNVVATILGADTNTTMRVTWFPRWLSA